jgi:hypothetical protein
MYVRNSTSVVKYTVTNGSKVDTVTVIALSMLQTLRFGHIQTRVTMLKDKVVS